GHRGIYSRDALRGYVLAGGAGFSPGANRRELDGSGGADRDFGAVALVFPAAIGKAAADTVAGSAFGGGFETWKGIGRTNTGRCTSAGTSIHGQSESSRSLWCSLRVSRWCS